MPVDAGKPFRIAIVGGGIAGLVTALSLHHHCHDQGIKVDVYEQAPQYKEIGAGVGIGPNAARILDKIGLLDKAYEIAGKRKHVWISFRRYDSGDDIVTIPAYEEGKVKQTPVHRAELLELLVSEIQTRGAATLHTNKQCQKLEVASCHHLYIPRRDSDVFQDCGETMTVTFADGTTVTADLVIGADGIHSNVRSHFIVSSPEQLISSSTHDSNTKVLYRMTTHASVEWSSTVVCVQSQSWKTGGHLSHTRPPGSLRESISSSSPSARTRS